MSNSRHLRRQLTDVLGQLDGARIPGGCELCTAYQTTSPLAAGVWEITIHHDVGCPRLAPGGG